MSRDHEYYMNRCIELAKQGLGYVAPNPLVGALLVHDGEIIGEGYHERYGEAHAEVNAIKSVTERERIPDATLYVTLEPCNHHGKTPPCSGLIIKEKIKQVVIGAKDANEDVSGGSAALLRQAGVDLIEGILKSEIEELNRRYITYHQKKRPYIILKWAETTDGFIARSDYSSKWISSKDSRKLVHQWRAEEAAILVGTNTACHDNPKLTVRDAAGENPIRIFIDRNLQIPKTHHLYDGSAPTIVLTQKPQHIPTIDTTEYSHDLAHNCYQLYKKGIQSLIVEGGAELLSSFIAEDLWEEARIFKSPQAFGEGIKAPQFNFSQNSTIESIGGDKLYIFRKA